MVRDLRVGSGVRRSLEQAALRGGGCKAPWIKNCQNFQFKRHRKSGFLRCKNY